MKTTTMEFGLKTLAITLIVPAVYFYWTGEPDYGFAAGVLAACSFFLSLRFRFKQRIDRRQAEKDNESALSSKH